MSSVCPSKDDVWQETYFFSPPFSFEKRWRFRKVAWRETKYVRSSDFPLCPRLWPCPGQITSQVPGTLNGITSWAFIVLLSVDCQLFLSCPLFTLLSITELAKWSVSYAWWLQQRLKGTCLTFRNVIYKHIVLMELQPFPKTLSLCGGHHLSFP